ncbi:uncharacterized protein KY384_000002 [Bacidia gigantensis]|uniref:uncharacterized protein n=1 Tax=Bacidia gigantensis TaxID=2732470 RepID=UPI001D039F4A|nr:uncharacterized protein KY384_000002 [Bacidia gigantensis]KAG8526409.1 hypothetical protein KY384_000002 [Bacidia gigantensis]
MEAKQANPRFIPAARARPTSPLVAKAPQEFPLALPDLVQNLSLHPLTEQTPLTNQEQPANHKAEHLSPAHLPDTPPWLPWALVPQYLAALCCVVEEPGITGKDEQCCIVTDDPEPECGADGSSDVCVDGGVEGCAAQGTPVTARCAGKDQQCCSPNIEECGASGNGGVCKPTGDCIDSAGTVTAGLCGGQRDVCCIPPDSTPKPTCGSGNNEGQCINGDASTCAAALGTPITDEMCDGDGQFCCDVQTCGVFGTGNTCVDGGLAGCLATTGSVTEGYCATDGQTCCTPPAIVTPTCGADGSGDTCQTYDACVGSTNIFPAGTCPTGQLCCTLPPAQTQPIQCTFGGFPGTCKAIGDCDSPLNGAAEECGNPAAGMACCAPYTDPNTPPVTTTTDRNLRLEIHDICGTAPNDRLTKKKSRRSSSPHQQPSPSSHKRTVFDCYTTPFEPSIQYAASEFGAISEVLDRVPTFAEAGTFTLTGDGSLLRPVENVNTVAIFDNTNGPNEVGFVQYVPGAAQGAIHCVVSGGGANDVVCIGTDVDSGEVVTGFFTCPLDDVLYLGDPPVSGCVEVGVVALFY